MINNVMHNPKISVILPVYNAELYLHQCLNSIINQTLKEIEIVCVDDGSTDASLEILKEYRVHNPNLSVISQKNAGSGPARNVGIINSSGKYVAFMDADDFYPDVDILEELYVNAEKHQVQICGGSMSNYNGSVISSFYSGISSPFIFMTNNFVSYHDYQFPYGYYRFIYNRKLLLENKIFFPPYRRGQDPPFFVRAMICSKDFYSISKITYCYRELHKKVEWNERQLNDFTNNIINLMTLAKDNNLDKLQYYTILYYNRFCLTLLMNNKISPTNIEFNSLNTEYNHLINEDWIKYKSLNFFPQKYIEKLLRGLVKKDYHNSLEIIKTSVKSILLLIISDLEYENILHLLPRYTKLFILSIKHM